MDFSQSPISSWRNLKSRYLLQGNKCNTCDKIFYPNKYLCPCGSTDFSDFVLSGKGKIVSFTQITSASKEFKFTEPYCLGLIELAEGPHVISQIVETELSGLVVGMPVSAVFRKLYSSGPQGIIHYGLKFAVKS